VLPEDWSKVLKPVCEYVFRGVFKDLPSNTAFPEYESESQELTGLPFSNFHSFADEERTLRAFKRDADVKIKHLDKYEEKFGREKLVTNSLLEAVRSYFGKAVKAKCFAALKAHTEQARLGDAERQRVYIENKQRGQALRAERTGFFNNWLLFMSKRREEKLLEKIEE
jgi:hypothetical protein